MLKHIGLAALLLAAVFSPNGLAAQTAEAPAEILQTAVVLSGDEAALDLELDTGRTLRIRLANGLVYVNGKQVGEYQPGGALEISWREFLRDVSAGESNGPLASLAGAKLEAGDTATEAIREALAPYLAVPASNLAISSAEDYGESAEEIASAAVEAAAASAAAALTAASIQIGDEVVEGGLVIQLSELEGLAQSLGRIGLSPGLERLLNGDLKAPVRIVLEADEYLLPQGSRLDGMLILVETDAVVAGTIGSNVLIADGTLLIAETGIVEGDVIGIDASIHNQGSILGELRSAEGLAPVVRAPAAPRVRVRGAAPSVANRIWGGLGSLAKTIAMYLFFGFLGALVVYFFRNNLEAVSDTVSYSFGRSFLAGLAGEVLFLPVGLVLTILIVTAIAVPFYALGFVLLGLLGYIGVAHAAGENLTRRRFSSTARMRRSNSYYYVLNGLGVLLALFVGAAITEMAYPLLGWAHDLLIASAWILTWVAATSGLGAALLSRAGTQRRFARPQGLPELPLDRPARSKQPYKPRAASWREPGGQR
jgi:hypothetical protein